MKTVTFGNIYKLNLQPQAAIGTDNRRVKGLDIDDEKKLASTSKEFFESADKGAAIFKLPALIKKHTAVQKAEIKTNKEGDYFLVTDGPTENSLTDNVVPNAQNAIDLPVKYAYASAKDKVKIQNKPEILGHF